MKPPSAEELVGPPPLCLDSQEVLRKFLGKTADEAQKMFQNHPVTEDFAYMTPQGLMYYLPAALDYLCSKHSSGDWEFAHGLLCSLSCQVDLSGIKGPALTVIQQIADYCDAHRAKFDMGNDDDLMDDYLGKIRLPDNRIIGLLASGTQEDLEALAREHSDFPHGIFLRFFEKSEISAKY